MAYACRSRRSPRRTTKRSPPRCAKPAASPRNRKEPPMMLRNFFAVLAAAALVAACSGTGSKTTDYKSAQSKAAQPLEVPPELTSPTMDDRYSIPDPKQQTTYSAYSQKIATGAPAEAPKLPTVLPKFEG